MDLQDKRIAITGAFGALGAAMVQAATAAGARVAAIDRAPVPADCAAAVAIHAPIGHVSVAGSSAAMLARKGRRRRAPARRGGAGAGGVRI